jgi:hypothetical protein
MRRLFLTLATGLAYSAIVASTTVYLRTGAAATCGNNVAEGSEVCDGTDLTGDTCLTVGGGYTGGTLACDVGCAAFDVTGCTTASGGDLIAETFNNTTDYDLGSSYFTEAGSGASGYTLSPNNTTAPPLGFGNFASEQLIVSITTTGRSRYIHRFTNAATAVTCGRVDMYVSAESIGDGDLIRVFGLLDASGFASTANPALVYLTQTAGQLQLQLRIDNAIVDTESISTGTTYKLEVTSNNTTNAWSWDINDTNAGSGTSEPLTSSTGLGMGIGSSVTAPTTVYFDNANHYTTSCP